MKKILSALLTLCVALSLMPVTARADGAIGGNFKVSSGQTLQELKAGEYAENYGTIVTNNGTVTGNHGTVTTNNGTVTDNYADGSIDTNSETGTVTTNYGHVHNNHGTINANSEKDGVKGDVYLNYETVGVNNGTIGLNRGLVEENHGSVDKNLGTVLNSSGGTVATNRGDVYNYGGTIGSSTSEGTEYFQVNIQGVTSSVTVSTTGLTSAYDKLWLGHKAGVLATATITLTPARSQEIEEITGLPDNVTAVKNSDGTWTLTVTSGKDTTITIPKTTEIRCTLTVINGRGSCVAIPGATVIIQADKPEAGKVFRKWEGTEGLVFTSGSEYTSTANIEMPRNDLTVTATYAPSFASHSLALDGKIGVIFYMDIPELYQEGSYMTFSISDGGECTERANFDAAFVVEPDYGLDGLYGFTCYVNSIQMADKITATFHYGDGQTLTKEYSVEDYFTSFENQVSNGKITDESTIALVRALADYGHYIRPFLEDYHGSDLYTGYNVLPARAGQLTAVNQNSEGLSASAPEFDLNGGLKAQYSMVFDSDTTLKVYFSGDVSSITVDDRQLTDLSSPIEIKSIKPQDFDVLHTIIFNAGGQTSTVKISGLTYVWSMLDYYGGRTDTEAANAKNAAAAIYNYWKCAEEYIQANP